MDIISSASESELNQRQRIENDLGRLLAQNQDKDQDSDEEKQQKDQQGDQKKPEKKPRKKPHRFKKTMLKDRKRGLQCLYFNSKRLLIHKKGNNNSDEEDYITQFNQIMNLYQEWHSQLMPKYDIDYFFDRCANFGKEADIKVYLDKMRFAYQDKIQWQDIDDEEEDELESFLNEANKQDETENENSLFPQNQMTEETKSENTNFNKTNHFANQTGFQNKYNNNNNNFQSNDPKFVNKNQYNNNSTNNNNTFSTNNFKNNNNQLNKKMQNIQRKENQYSENFKLRSSIIDQAFQNMKPPSSEQKKENNQDPDQNEEGEEYVPEDVLMEFHEDVNNLNFDHQAEQQRQKQLFDEMEEEFNFKKIKEN